MRKRIKKCHNTKGLGIIYLSRVTAKDHTKVLGIIGQVIPVMGHRKGSHKRVRDNRAIFLSNDNFSNDTKGLI